MTKRLAVELAAKDEAKEESNMTKLRKFTLGGCALAALIGASFAPTALSVRAEGAETETSQQMPEESIPPVSESISEEIPSKEGASAEPASEEPDEEPSKEVAKVRYSVFYVNADNETVQDKKDVLLGEETYLHGDVLFYADEWNVGDEVRFAVKRNASYKSDGTKLYIGSYAISSVSVSFSDSTSQTLLPTDGVYSFVARDDQNLSVVFSNDIEPFTSMDLSETNWKSFFSTQNLVTIVMFLLTLLVASGASVVITKLAKRLAKKESSDAKEIASMVTTAVDPVVTQAFNKYVAPSISKMGDETDKNTAMIKGLAKCIILMQSDKPEDKIALATEMETLDKDTQGVSEQVKKAMQEVIDSTQKKKAEQQEAIKKVEEATASLRKESKKDAEDIPIE